MKIDLVSFISYKNLNGGNLNYEKNNYLYNTCTC